LKTRFIAALRGVWQFLTVIPGWPDAGKVARTFYVLPLAVPFLVLFLLWGWDRIVRSPEMRALRDSSQPAVQLETEVAELRETWPDTATAESASATASSVQATIRNPADMEAQLAAMRASATALGWVGVFHAGDAEPQPSAAAVPVVLQSVRGRLTPAAGNQASFASLLTLFDRLAPADKRGGIVRLAVHGDDQGHITAEIGVRFAALSPDAKTP
jgi:hypothetical protein